MSRPITIISNGIIKSQQSINHQNHISFTSTTFDFSSSTNGILFDFSFKKEESIYTLNQLPTISA